MNQGCYRVIFNQKRGQTMVVGELARTPGQASRSSTPTARWLRCAQPLVFTFILGWSALTQAAIVADSNAPAAQQPSVVTAPNGAPVVNIQTPNAAGVSHNTYSRFDVEQPGAVLNNSAAATQTQLAGAIAGNAHLANGTARLILNEVNSSDPTVLSGMIEVAGQGAHVVIANPSGIYINGGGFINTTGATLTTGQPQFKNGQLDSYRVTSGTIKIEGQGLNSRDTDYTAIMARAVEVNSHLQAKKLTITTGSNQVQADNNQATPITTTEAAPTVALDVAQLGGMYAEHIFIVGTEAGVGIRNAGRLTASTGSVVVNSDGWLTHTGLVVARENVNLQAQQTLTLQGEIKSGGTQSYQGSTLEGMGVTLKGQSLTLQATQGALQLPGATLESQQTLTLTTPTVLNTDAATLRAEKLQLSARDLSNIGGNLVQHGPEDLPLKMTGTLDNSNGRIASNSHQLTLQAQTVNNQGGRIEHAGQGDLQIEAQTLLGQRGHFGSNSAVVLRTAQAELQQATTQGTQVTLNGKPWQPSHEALATLGNQSLQPYPTALRERVSTLPLALTLPTSGLFSVNTQPGVPLVTTDPKFIRQRQYVSSERLLRALKVDLKNLPKPFGDGFYEQQQLRDAVIQMTSQRFIGDYQDDDTQYRALIANAISAAKTLQLQPGVPLSNTQMAQLTRDIVWPVQASVQAPDGSQVQVLAPQLYLRVPEGTIGAGYGSLISAKNILLDLSGNFTGNGTTLARDTLSITAENIHHQGGTLYGGKTHLKARQDINHQGGLVSGDTLLQVEAGRDVTAETTTVTTTGGDPNGSSYSSHTNLGQRAKLLVRQAGGVMAVQAGRDANLVATQILNAGEGGHTQIRAGHDLKLSTAQVGQHEQLIWDENNHRVEGGYRDVGSQIKTVGTLQLHAGNKLTATAAQVASGVSAQSVAALVQGPLALEQEGSGAAPLVSTEQSLEAQLAAGTLQMSAKSIEILPGQATRYLDEAHQKTHSGLFNDKTTTSRIVQQETIALGSQFIGTQTEMVATEGDLRIHGSSVLGEQGTTLIAQEGNIKITSAENRQRQISYHQVEESGLLTGGGAALTLGERESSQQQELEGTQQQSSAVGSLLGDVRIWAKQKFQQLGSHLITPQGDINVSAATIEVLDTHHQQQLTQESSSSTSGFTMSVSNPAVSALQTAQQLQSAVGQTSDPRMHALAAAAGGLAAKNTYDALQCNPQQLGGINVTTTFGSSESHSESSEHHTTSQRSLVSGRRVIIQARSGDATIQGDLQAQELARIAAAGNLKLLASENRGQQESSQSSSSQSFGVGRGIVVGMSEGEGSSQGESCRYQLAQVHAGQKVELESGGDTLVQGVVSAPQIQAAIAGNLTIESLQDTDHQEGEQQQIGINLDIGPMVSGSLNFNQSDYRSDFKSVQQQAGLEAGDLGYQLDVKGNFHLGAGGLKSSAKAVTAGRNKARASTLTQSQLDNYDKHNAQSISGSIGFSQHPQKPGQPALQDGGVGKNQSGQAAPGALQVPGSGLPSHHGLSATIPIVTNARGSASSTTRSVISGARQAVTITNPAAQLALTGQTPEQAIAAFDASVTSDKDSSNALSNSFNLEEIKAGFQIVEALTREVGTFLDNRAKEQTKTQTDLTEEQGKALEQQNTQKIAALQERLQENQLWEMGGKGRILMSALSLAAGSNITGSTGQLLQAATVNVIQSYGAQQIKLLADSMNSEVARTALQGLLAGAGAAAQGQSATPAALGASASVVLNNLIDSAYGETSSTLSLAEREARKNLVSTLITGTTQAIGGEAALANAAATLEMENNYLSRAQCSRRNQELSEGENLLHKAAIRAKWD
ncbi:two-partner secretion domain-containing protein [unidentified bacterial endosymbiont]|nr:hemagglutinin repeat-containing protein [unidentified bacterial endosymbiont]